MHKRRWTRPDHQRHLKGVLLGRERQKQQPQIMMTPARGVARRSVAIVDLRRMSAALAPVACVELITRANAHHAKTKNREESESSNDDTRYAQTEPLIGRGFAAKAI